MPQGAAALDDGGGSYEVTEKEERVFSVTPPLPLFPPRRPPREAATSGRRREILRRVKATEGEGGRGRGGEHKLPSMCVDGGKMNFPLPIGSVKGRLTLDS
ncbi:hypothetical protein Sjap_023097 [Stephania japonica]|uniref:Uncharacterized protein n=1 Tax=Stephania japonica TaxID=461633 RepID=A0AAP0EQ40_9MAGN